MKKGTSNHPVYEDLDVRFITAKNIFQKSIDKSIKVWYNNNTEKEMR